jgi:apolipoprotein D and lipocalin family protein
MKNLGFAALLALSACGTPYVRTSANLDDPLYLHRMEAGGLEGRWFVAASFPAPFEEGCSHQTVDLSARADGRMDVASRCRVGDVTQQSGGVADLAATVPQGKRLGAFVFDGDYRILKRSRDGRTLLVGTPTRITGWMLHRDRPQRRRNMTGRAPGSGTAAMTSRRWTG